MKKTIWVTLSLLSSSVFAGGYQLMEYSPANLGRAFAGAGLVGDDYAAIALNPAGMTLLGTGIQAGLHAVAIDAETSGQLLGGGSSKSGSSGVYTSAFLPHFFAQKACGNWRLGLGIYTPLGLEVTYHNPAWVGSTHAISSEVVSLDFAPTLAYQVNRYLSLGAGVYLEYLSAKLTNMVLKPVKQGEVPIYSELKADGWQLGVNLGILFQPWEKTRLGVSYRSQNVNHLSGKHYLYGVADGLANAHLASPAHLLISLQQGIMDRLDFLASARWTKWDCFSALNIRSSLSANPIFVEENWRNVWTFAVGMNYRLNQNWMLRLGGSFDKTPIPDAAHRTARIPDSNRFMLTTGVGYRYKNWQWDVSYAHLFFNDSETNHKVGSSTWQAKYKMETNIIACSVQYHF